MANDNLQVSANQGTSVHINIVPDAPSRLLLTPDKVWGTTDYEGLNNKPKINGVELNKNTTLNDLGVSTEQIEQNKNNVEDILKYLDEITPKNTSEKKNSVQITDALNLDVFSLTMDGNSQQDTTEGYNLYDNSFTTQPLNITYSKTIANNGVKITINTIVDDTKTSWGFYFSLKSYVDTLGFQDGDKILIKYKLKTTNPNSLPSTFGSWENGRNLVFTPSTSKVCTSWSERRIIGEYNASAERGALNFYTTLMQPGDVFEIRDIMICKSDVDKPYEMPTGGKPSPSLDYQQPITSINTAQIFQHGKNLYNQATCDGASRDGMTVTMQEDGGLHIVGLPERSYVSLHRSGSSAEITKYLIDGESYTISQNIPGYIYLQVTAAGKSITTPALYITSSNSPTNKANTFKVDKSKYRYAIAVQTSEKTKFTEPVDIILYPQLERGVAPTEFEKFKQETINLDLKGHTVNKISDEIKDYIVTDKKKYWLVKNTEKRIFDGTEQVGRETTNVANKYRFKIVNIGAYGVDYVITAPLLCNSFPVATRGANWNALESICYTQESENGIMIYAEETSAMTVDEFKTWLSKKNIEVCYRLKTPQIIELGELPQALKTEEGINNISVKSNLDTDIEIVYALDIKKYYDDKIAKLSSQIL